MFKESLRVASGIHTYTLISFYEQVNRIGLLNMVLWRPTINVVQLVKLLWRDFICIKIPQGNANKSASRLYVYAPKVIVPPSVFNLPSSCEHHTTLLPSFISQQYDLFRISVIYNNSGGSLRTK